MFLALNGRVDCAWTFVSYRLAISLFDEIRLIGRVRYWTIKSCSLPSSTLKVREWQPREIKHHMRKIRIRQPLTIGTKRYEK